MHISAGIWGFLATSAKFRHKEPSPVPDSPRRYHEQSWNCDWICLPPPPQTGSLTYISNRSQLQKHLLCFSLSPACREGEPGSLSAPQSGAERGIPPPSAAAQVSGWLLFGSFQRRPCRCPTPQAHAAGRHLIHWATRKSAITMLQPFKREKAQSTQVFFRNC